MAHTLVYTYPLKNLALIPYKSRARSHKNPALIPIQIPRSPHTIPIQMFPQVLRGQRRHDRTGTRASHRPTPHSIYLHIMYLSVDLPL